MVLVTLLAVALSALLYRFGGLGEKDWQERWSWVPRWMIHGKARDVGCSLITLGWMAFFYHGPWWAYVVAFGIQFGMTTTYWDWITGKDNFFLHGLGIALAMLPFAISSGMWIGFAIRCVVLALAMGLWCLFWMYDDAEELGRGGFIQATLPLMMI